MKKVIKKPTNLAGIRKIMIRNAKGKYVEAPKAYEATIPCIRDGDKSRRWEAFTTQAEALAARDKGQAEVAGFVPNSEKKLKPIFMHELFDEFVKMELSQSAVSSQRTRLSRKRHLKFLLRKSVKIESVTPHFLDRWMARLKDPRYLRLQHSTRLTYNEELRLVKLMLKYYQETHDYRFPFPLLSRHKKNAVVRRRPLKKRKYLSPEGFAALISEIGRQVQDMPEGQLKDVAKRVHMVATLQFPLLGRIQDIPALRADDVDFSSQEISIRRRVVWDRRAGGEIFIIDGSKATEGKIIYSPFACKVIANWMQSEGITSGPLFYVNGSPLSYRQIQYRYDSAFKALGMEKSGTHVLRHGSGTTLHQVSGGNLKQAAKGLGHTNTRHTDDYVVVTEDDFRSSLSKMDDLLQRTTH